MPLVYDILHRNNVPILTVTRRRSGESTGCCGGWWLVRVDGGGNLLSRIQKFELEVGLCVRVGAVRSSSSDKA